MLAKLFQYPVVIFFGLALFVFFCIGFRFGYFAAMDYFAR